MRKKALYGMFLTSLMVGSFTYSFNNPYFGQKLFYHIFPHKCVEVNISCDEGAEYLEETVERELNQYSPKWVLSKYNEDNGNIFIYNGLAEEYLAKPEAMNDIGSSSYTIAFFNSKTRQIVLSSDESLIKVSIMHEMGHYFDRINGFKSKEKRFEEIREKEYESFALLSDNPHYSTNEEYFAECFNLYCKYPSLLDAFCPDTYKFIDRLVK